MSVGSSVDIVWNGGAQPWILNPENHFHKLKTEDTNLIEVKEKQSSKIPNGYYVYSVTCSTLGETKMELEVRLVLFFPFLIHLLCFWNLRIVEKSDNYVYLVRLIH